MRELANARMREENSEAVFASSYRDLKVFQASYQLALDIHKVSLTFPKIEQYALADQLRRSSKSVCANIAEGFARQRASKAEWKRFLMIALGSCEEVQMWLDFAKDLRYINADQSKNWQDQSDKICRMLHKLRGTS